MCNMSLDSEGEDRRCTQHAYCFFLNVHILLSLSVCCAHNPGVPALSKSCTLYNVEMYIIQTIAIASKLPAWLPQATLPC